MAGTLQFTPIIQDIWDIIILSLYKQSLVYISSSKSDLFQMSVGLYQGCPSSLVLFITFMV